MKIEWKKEDKDLYLPKTKPVVVEVPVYNYITIKGIGDPNKEDFAKRMEVLYSLSYTIKMMPKGGYTPEGYYEYTVYPLEGIWSLTEEGMKMEKLSKDEFSYTVMIRQPDFVNEELFNKAKEKVKKKRPDITLLDEAKFEPMRDGKCVQMMHLGPYDDEPKSFELMHKFLDENNLERTTKIHKEIYLSDPRKTTPDKLKTVLRIYVKENS